MAEYTEEEFHNAQRRYWRQVAATDGFDVENVVIPPSMSGMITGLMPYDCRGFARYPYRDLVKNYASLGLHRYNLLKGTRFQFGDLQKLNMLQNAVSSFYMTLRAYESGAPDSREQDTFQVRVDEKRYNHLDITCSVARLKDEVTTKKPFIPHFHGGAAADGIFKGDLPDWPSDDDLKDEKRFYLVKKSEWEQTDNNWILTYLKLLIFASDRSITELIRPNSNLLSELEILKVAIETGVEDGKPPNERLKAKSVYIMFKGLAEARAGRQVFESGEQVERKVIVRRVLDEHSGYLTLQGKFCDEPQSE